MFAFKKKTNHLEKIWFEDVTELINKKNIFTIIPQKNFTTNQNINAVMRLSIIISIILVILYRKVEYLFIVVCTMIGSYVYNTITIKEFFPDTQDIYKASFSKPYNPLGNKLIGESYDKYMNTYLVSNDDDIKENILYEYNKIRQKMPETNISDDILNSKQSLLGFYPLADKTGIPNFSEFAKNTYGTIIEDRSELIKRGYLSKSDLNRDNGLANIKDIFYDPLNLESIGTVTLKETQASKGYDAATYDS
tara:strand:+ start:20 stop:769 length:750 start_codon:yes stop_codon:yes gene_type:complete